MQVAPLLRGFLARTWPYLSGLLACVILALAERESRQSTVFGAGISLGDWFTSRLSAPMTAALADPVDAWPAWLLLVLLPLFAIFKRWWLAPLATGSIIAWCIWGTMLIGRMG